MSDFSDEFKVLHAGKHLALACRGSWEFATRRGASGVVGVVAVTDERRLLLVEQFRQPVGQTVIELPAGLAGDVQGASNEPLTTAAHRELLEETGYEAGEMRRLSVGPSSAGLTDETIVLFMASKLVRRASGGGDDSEQITVHEVHLDEAPRWLMRRVADGQLVDFKVFAGLWFLDRPDWMV